MVKKYPKINLFSPTGTTILKPPKLNINTNLLTSYFNGLGYTDVCCRETFYVKQTIFLDCRNT
jgi:hypothetical protein